MTLEERSDLVLARALYVNGQSTDETLAARRAPPPKVRSSGASVTSPQISNPLTGMVLVPADASLTVFEGLGGQVRDG
jgi:hypothetical protein